MSGLRETLRGSWWMVVALLAALGAVVYGVANFSGGGEAPKGRPAVLPNRVMSEDEMRGVLFKTPGDGKSDLQKRNEASLAEYRARYDGNPDDPEAPALLRAMGNLYRQTMDYENAAWAYQQLISRFPDSPGARLAWAELVTCFERLKDTDNLTRTCLDMMKAFPEDSDEYRFAQAKLKLSKETLVEPNAEGQGEQVVREGE